MNKKIHNLWDGYLVYITSGCPAALPAQNPNFDNVLKVILLFGAK